MENISVRAARNKLFPGKGCQSVKLSTTRRNFQGYAYHEFQNRDERLRETEYRVAIRKRRMEYLLQHLIELVRLFIFIRDQRVEVVVES
jgi:hypothetical protein